MNYGNYAAAAYLAHDYYRMLAKARDSFASDGSSTGLHVKMLGIFLARPASAMAKADIIPHLNDWHFRSRRRIDFFMAGYRKEADDWDGNSAADVKLEVPGQGTCVYNAEDFDDFRSTLEGQTSWQYGGGCELLLTNAWYESDLEYVRLDFESAMCCRLDAMKSDSAFPSVEQFVEKIIRFAETCKDDDPTWSFSDSAGLQVFGSAIKRAVLSLLPKGLDSAYREAEHYAVRDVRGR